ncbi:MAG: Asp23/Gls24 family envelope stress response protein [Clostridiales bacterium]|nr:Asp23/Gls24 family envelope stress response protein [Clostridiales bacterium]
MIKTNNSLYGRNVVRDIIALAAKEISGVANLHGRGIRAELSGKVINVDVYLVIEFGYSVPDVAYRVQDNIKRSVETMTEYSIDTVNVSVLGVRFHNEEAS